MSVQAVPFRDPLRKPALACGALVAVSIGIAALGKPAGEVPRFTAAPAAVEVALSFTDGPDGSVVARDAQGLERARFAVGEGGFVRVALRSLASHRRKLDAGMDAPFVLAKLENGELVLRDPATGRAVLLDAFGQSNAGAFAGLLEKPADKQGGKG